MFHDLSRLFQTGFRCARQLPIIAVVAERICASIKIERPAIVLEVGVTSSHPVECRSGVTRLRMMGYVVPESSQGSLVVAICVIKRRKPPARPLGILPARKSFDHPLVSRCPVLQSVRDIE